MADRRRRRPLKSDEESEDCSTESEPELENKEPNLPIELPKKEVEKADSEYESAEEEGQIKATPEKLATDDPTSKLDVIEVGQLPEDVESPNAFVEEESAFIDEEGGEEDIAEKEEVTGEFAEEDILLLDVSEENNDEEREAEEEANEEEDQREGLEDEVEQRAVLVDEEEQRAVLVDEEEQRELEDEEDILEEQEVGDEEEDGEERDAEDEEEEDDVEDEEEDDCVEEERQQGDGEECSPSAAAEKELDFDEDRRNPQYIPKKGTFYEHDDRNSSEVPKEKEAEPIREKKKKKLWLDEGKWGHDRYREDEQVPKSRTELIEVYGYDIRCEDCPPRARRRRRYGRGPTKYDRNWKDETAYEKERNFVFRGRGRGGVRGFRSRGSFRGGISNNFHANSNRKVNNFVNGHKEPNANYVPEVQDKPVSPRTEEVPVNAGPWDNNNVEATDEISINNEDFPSLPTKEIDQRPATPEEKDASAYIRTSSPPAKEVESVVENNSVRSQTFENSRYFNKTSSSYQKPPRRGKMPPFGRDTMTHGSRDTITHGSRDAITHSNRDTMTHSNRDTMTHSNRDTMTHSNRDTMTHSHSNRDTMNHSNRDYNVSNNNNSYKQPPRTAPIRGRRARGSGSRYNSSRDSGYIRPILAPRLMDKQVRAISNEIERLTMNDDCEDPLPTHGILSVTEQKKSSVCLLKESNGPPMPLKSEDSSNRPKRYSSLRQRSLPETTNFPPNQPPVQAPHQPFYDTGYQAAIYGPDGVDLRSQAESSASPPILNPSQYQQFSHTPYQETASYNLRLPVPTPPPRLFPQVTLPSGQPIIPAPATCITPNPAGIINFPPPPPPAAGYPQFAYQQYPTPPPPPPPVSQTPDMFRGGITYYYPQTQPPPIRHVPQKRIKAAIPIIPPPEPKAKHSEKQKNAMPPDPQNSSSNVNSSENSDDLLQSDSPTVQTYPAVEVEG